MYVYILIYVCIYSMCGMCLFKKNDCNFMASSCPQLVEFYKVCN